MSVSIFWILLLGGLSLSQAAPTVAPTISTDDQTRAEETGSLNNEPLEAMRALRCGVVDVTEYQHFPGKPKWEKTLITYRITQYTPDLSQRQVDETISNALRLYSDVIPLNFKQIDTGTADIMILFQSRDHGDSQPFDGPGEVLAHASAPTAGQIGVVHFDDDETWTLTQQGVNLLLVAAHEFGHVLGLAHSQDRGALMYPQYQYVEQNKHWLPDDDRQGVQALYAFPRNYTRVDNCGNPPRVWEAIHSYSQSSMFLTYRCSSNIYKLRGDPKVWCRYGQWTRTPICEDNFCIMDTSRHSHLVQTRIYYILSGDYLKFDCVNSEMGTARAKCEDNQLYVSECCSRKTHWENNCPYSHVP